MNLEEKTVIVTGASRGIGRALACAFGSAGANVVCCARSAGSLRKTASMVEDRGGGALAVPTDVTDATDVEKMVSSALDEYGRVDILFNNAGSFSSIGAVWESDPGKWWTDVTVNLYGAFLCCRAVLPHMMERNNGIIINMNGGRPTGGTGYAAGKAGLMELSRVLVEELKAVDSDVIVFTAGPGLVDTEMTRKQADTEAGRRWIPSTQSKIEAGETRAPEEIAGKAVQVCRVARPELTGLNFNPDTDVASL